MFSIMNGEKTWNIKINNKNNREKITASTLTQPFKIQKKCVFMTTKVKVRERLHKDFPTILNSLNIHTISFSIKTVMLRPCVHGTCKISSCLITSRVLKPQFCYGHIYKCSLMFRPGMKSISVCLQLKTSCVCL